MDQSNIGEVVQYLKDFVDGVDFTLPGRSQSLGRDLAETQVDRIMVRSEQQQCAPDGTVWARNSTTPTPWRPQGYKQWKEDKYGWPDEPNRRTNQMLSKKSLYGRTRITPKEIILIYGTDTTPSDSRSPTGYFDPKTDGKVTDVQKAEWAHNGSARNPARPFYGVGAGDEAALVAVAQEALDTYIRTSPYAVG